MYLSLAFWRKMHTKENLLATFELTPQEYDMMGAWLYRQYYSEKYAASPWFESGVTESDSLVKFCNNLKAPLSPSQVVEFWRSINKLKDSFELLGTRSKEVPEPKQEIYHTDGPTIRGVTALLGISSHQMTNKTASVGCNKIKKLVNNEVFNDQAEKNLVATLEKVETIREELALKFTSLLVQSASIAEFEERLHNEKLLNSRMDLEEVDFKRLEALKSFSAAEIYKFLLLDAENDESYIRVFQNVVSCKVYGSRPGRKRKVKS